MLEAYAAHRKVDRLTEAEAYAARGLELGIKMLGVEHQGVGSLGLINETDYEALKKKILSFDT